MIDPRAVAVEGIGYDPRLVALLGLFTPEDQEPEQLELASLCIQVRDTVGLEASVTELTALCIGVDDVSAAAPTVTDPNSVTATIGDGDVTLTVVVTDGPVSVSSVSEDLCCGD